MSAPSFYDGSIKYAINALASLTHILKKAEAAPNSASFPNASIHPDMQPLHFQVFIVTNISQQLLARASGTEPLALSRELKTFDDFYARIKQVTDLLATADEKKINDRVSATVTVGMGPGKNIDMPTSDYVSGYAVPNIFFHLTTAYDILRKEGVDLGKQDFLASFLGKYAS